MLIQSFSLKNNTAFHSQSGLKGVNPNISDAVIFSGSVNLLKKYNIKPEEISVISSSEIYINEQEKIDLIKKILEAHELALKTN